MIITSESVRNRLKRNESQVEIELEWRYKKTHFEFYLRLWEDNCEVLARTFDSRDYNHFFDVLILFLSIVQEERNHLEISHLKTNAHYMNKVRYTIFLNMSSLTTSDTKQWEKLYNFLHS